MTVEEVKNAYAVPKNGGSIMPVANQMDRLSTNPNGGNSTISDADRAARNAALRGASTGAGGAVAPANPATPAANAAAPLTGADRINQMYDAQKEANRLQLENAFNQNMSDAQAAHDKIAPQYQQSANDLSVQFERARRNMNTQGIGSGINSGAATQMGLSQTNEYLRDFGKLRSEEANAIAESERNMLNIKTQYQNAVAAAVADNDYKRAAALYDDFMNQNNLDLQKAQNLAQYGDFSMYAQIYGPEQAANMEAYWKATNPDAAYNTGKLTPEEYKKITGKYPPGYKKSGGSGYGGSGKSYSGSILDGIGTNSSMSEQEYTQFSKGLNDAKSNKDVDKYGELINAAVANDWISGSEADTLVDRFKG